MKRLVMMAAGACALAIAATPAAAQTTIKVYASMSKNLLYTKLFLEHFVKTANEAGKGTVKLNFIGGPEVTPSRKSAQALQRGVFDIVYGPAGYYAGDVPEALALHGATVDPDTLRKNGGFAMIDKIWGERVGAKVLAWGIHNVGYNLFFTTEPKVTDDKLDLSGMKMRASPTYKPRIESLGGTPVRIPAPEMYTALQRGIVKGTGWPEIGIAGTGIAKLVKFKVEPKFYRSNHLVIMNRKTWNKLSPKARDILMKAAAEYEKKSVAAAEKAKQEGNAKLASFGIKTIELKGKAREHWIKSGNDALWAAVAKRSKNAEALRAKLEPKQ